MNLFLNQIRWGKDFAVHSKMGILTILGLFYSTVDEHINLC